MLNLKHTLLAAALALGFATTASADAQATRPACPAYEKGLIEYTLNAFTQEALLQEFTERGTKPGFTLEPFADYRRHQALSAGADVGAASGYAYATHSAAWLSAKSDAQVLELLEREARLTRMFHVKGNPCFEYSRDVRAKFNEFVLQQYAKLGSLPLKAEDLAEAALDGVPEGEMTSYAIMVFMHGDLEAQRDFENKTLNGVTLPLAPKELVAKRMERNKAAESAKAFESLIAGQNKAN